MSGRETRFIYIIHIHQLCFMLDEFSVCESWWKSRIPWVWLLKMLKTAYLHKLSLLLSRVPRVNCTLKINSPCLSLADHLTWKYQVWTTTKILHIFTRNILYMELFCEWKYFKIFQIERLWEVNNSWTYEFPIFYMFGMDMESWRDLEEEGWRSVIPESKIDQENIWI